ncbi:MAG: bactofilin family protein [Hyphomicrobiaceae bacterium]
MGKELFVVLLDVNIYGTVDADTDVRVEGRIDGTLICRRADITASATVVGDVVAEEVIVAGIVDGSIYADRLSLLSNSYVYGDIHHSDLNLHEGCYFEGKSRHSDAPRSMAPLQPMRSLPNIAN